MTWPADSCRGFPRESPPASWSESDQFAATDPKPVTGIHSRQRLSLGFGVQTGCPSCTRLTGSTPEPPPIGSLGEREVVALLLRHGGDPTLVDWKDRTARAHDGCKNPC